MGRLRLSERLPVAAKEFGEIEACHAGPPFRDADQPIGLPATPFQ
ncbi:MAG: hypothetical protein PHP88_12710 [bacterium]|nr:hypothetical protein [bacterium]